MIDVVYYHPQLLSNREHLTRFTNELLEYCLKDLQYPTGSLSVLYCSKARIGRLNNDFMQKEGPTDVLSFPSGEDLSHGEVEAPVYLGDIAVCLPYCAKQAPSFHRPLEEEVALMLVHGLLHLLGHDHDVPDRKSQMWKETDRLLKLIKSIKRPGLEVRG